MLDCKELSKRALVDYMLGFPGRLPDGIEDDPVIDEILIREWSRQLPSSDSGWFVLPIRRLITEMLKMGADRRSPFYFGDGHVITEADIVDMVEDMARRLTRKLERCAKRRVRCRIYSSYDIGFRYE